MTTLGEREFHAEMVRGAERLKREIGYNQTRFTRMVGEHGGVEAARHLLHGADASDGFTTLWEAQRLDVSVEAIVLLPWYESVFADAEREVARNRLAEYRFDADAFIAERSRRAPAWTVESE